MKKFILFDEYQSKAIYGEDAKDALQKEGELHTPSKWSDGRKVSDGDTIKIDSVVGIEDTSNTARGSKQFIRVLAQTDKGKILAVDMVEEGVKIE